MRRGIILLVIALLVALLLPSLLSDENTWQRVARFPLAGMLLLLSSVIVGWVINGVRLRILIGKSSTLTLGRATAIVMATEFSMCATPAGAGGPVTLCALLKRQGLPWSRGTAVFAAEHLCDLAFFIGAFLAVGVYTLTHAISGPFAGWAGASLALLGAITAFLVLGYRYHHGMLLLTGRVLSRLGVKRLVLRRWTKKTVKFRRSFSEGLRLSGRTWSLALLLTTGHWLLRSSILYWVLLGMDQPLSWAWAFLVQMLSMTVGQLSLLPSGAGGTELAAMAMLVPLVGSSVAMAAILLWRFVTFQFYLMAGGLAFLALVGRSAMRRLLAS